MLPGRHIDVLNPVGVYLHKMNNEYDKWNCGVCSKLTVKTLEPSQLTSLQYLFGVN